MHECNMRVSQWLIPQSHRITGTHGTRFGDLRTICLCICLHCYRDSWGVAINPIFTSTPAVYAALEATPAFPHDDEAVKRAPSEGTRIGSIDGID